MLLYFLFTQRLSIFNENLFFSDNNIPLMEGLKEVLSLNHLKIKK